MEEVEQVMVEIVSTAGRPQEFQGCATGGAGNSRDLHFPAGACEHWGAQHEVSQTS
jgi:hypothetical protein